MHLPDAISQEEPYYLHSRRYLLKLVGVRSWYTQGVRNPPLIKIQGKQTVIAETKE